MSMINVEEMTDMLGLETWDDKNDGAIISWEDIREIRSLDGVLVGSIVYCLYAGKLQRLVYLGMTDDCNYVICTRPSIIKDVYDSNINHYLETISAFREKVEVIIRPVELTFKSIAVAKQAMPNWEIEEYD